MEYMVNLEQFYGPLDLLLYLIEKNQMNIYDIPISIITDQYLEYIETANNIDLDQLGDFLVMASYLLNLKSQMLLPGSVEAENEKGEDEEVLDPREELTRKLLAYKRFKLAAVMLESRLDDNYPRMFFRHGILPEVEGEISASVKSLRKAYWRLLEEQALPNREIYQIPQGDINVGEKMEDIQQLLRLAGRPMSFCELYNAESSRREILAAFLALLELVRLHQVEAKQNERFGEIILSNYPDISICLVKDKNIQ